MDDDTLDKDKKLFPQKLWDLINDDRYRYCLRWSDDGERVYLNRDEFEEQYLKTSLNQFHTQKAISFVRQMNMYGFRKVDDYYYENENFKRDYQHLLRKMIRRHPIKNSTSPSPVPLCVQASHHGNHNTQLGASNGIQSFFNHRATSIGNSVSTAGTLPSSNFNNSSNNNNNSTNTSNTNLMQAPKLKRQYPIDRQQEPQDLSNNSSQNHSRNNNNSHSKPKVFKHSKQSPMASSVPADYFLGTDLNHQHNDHNNHHHADAPNVHDIIQSATSSIFGLPDAARQSDTHHHHLNFNNIFNSSSTNNNNQQSSSSHNLPSSTSIATQFVRDICDQRLVFLDAQASLEAERLTEKFLSALIDDAKMIVEHKAGPNSIEPTHRPHIDASSLSLALKLMTLRLLGALGD